LGLMDKVKAQATQLAQKTQETARDGKAKFDQAQANKRADALLRNLGALVYAQRTGRGGGDAQAQIDKLVADISAHEAENGISLAQQADQPPAGGPVPGGQSGATFQDPGPTSTLNFGDAAPAVTFPDSGAATSFPDPAATSFPDSATSFPDSGTPTSFPDSGSATSLSGSETPTSFPDSGTATSFPDSGSATSFPDSGTATSFPESDGAPSQPEPGASGS
jgi:hypothetical protein